MSHDNNVSRVMRGHAILESDLSKVTLREITKENVRSICELSVSESQKPYVASNATALAEASYSNDERPQAIYADNIPVGLAVLRIQPKESNYFLWRLMIDAQYQGSQYGRRAMDLLIQQAKSDPDCDEFLTSVVPGDHSPQGFYESLGFELTGEWYEGEAILKLSL